MKVVLFGILLLGVMHVLRCQVTYSPTESDSLGWLRTEVRTLSQELVQLKRSHADHGKEALAMKVALETRMEAIGSVLPARTDVTLADSQPPHLNRTVARDMVSNLFKESVPPANSPYVPKQELEAINALHNHEGASESSGCNESVYGELMTDAVSDLLRQQFPPLGRSDVFYDLGSGRGASLALAVYEFGVRRAVGVEMSQRRVEIACGALKALKNVTGPSVTDTPHAVLQIFQGNFLEHDITDATFIYLASTCYRESLMYSLLLKFLENTKPLRVLTLEKLPVWKLPSDSPARHRIHVGATLQAKASWTDNAEAHTYTILAAEPVHKKYHETQHHPELCSLQVDKFNMWL